MQSMSTEMEDGTNLAGLRAVESTHALVGETCILYWWAGLIITGAPNGEDHAVESIWLGR